MAGRLQYTSLKQQAKEHQSAFKAAARENGRRNGQLVSFGHLGPLKDPMWDAMFQAMENQGVTELADSSVGAKKKMWGKSRGYQPTFDPTFQGTAAGKTNQLGADVPSFAALDALLRGRR